MLDVLSNIATPVESPPPPSSFPPPNIAGFLGREKIRPAVFANWGKEDASACEWDFVDCDVDGFVSRIDVQDVELNLPFPAGFASLPRLRSLVISECNLSGVVPDEVGEFGALQVLDVSSNSLLGVVPAAIGKLQSLEELVLNSNHLTGSIPAEVGACAELKILTLFRRRLEAAQACG
uniref:Leucine-rich repeat-containing N-terminal plant-type domain-containing protein n=1 Tax=Kalanchoe fedtschenkoi TaxID=63787 RepID=A0A7N0V116_KALFE